MKASQNDPREIRPTDDEVEVEAESFDSDSSGFSKIDDEDDDYYDDRDLQKDVHTAAKQRQAATPHIEYENSGMNTNEVENIEGQSFLPALAKSLSSKDREGIQALSNVRQNSRLLSGGMFQLRVGDIVGRGSAKSSVTFGAGSASSQRDGNYKASEQHSSLETLNPMIQEQVQVESLLIGRTLNKYKSVNALPRDSIDNIEQLTKVLATSNKTVTMRVGDKDFSLSSELLTQLVTMSDNGSVPRVSESDNIYISDQRTNETVLVNKETQTDKEQQQLLHLSSVVSSPKEMSSKDTPQNARDIYRHRSAQYTSEVFSINLDKEQSKGIGQSMLLDRENQLSQIDTLTEDNFFEEGLNMNMAPFLSSSSPKVENQQQKPNVLRKQNSLGANELSGITEQKSQNEDDDIENAFWGESSKDDQQEDSMFAFSMIQPQTFGMPSIPQKVQNPHKQLVQDMPKRVAFAQQIERTSKPDQRIGLSARRLSSALKKTSSVKSMTCGYSFQQQMNSPFMPQSNNYMRSISATEKDENNGVQRQVSSHPSIQKATQQSENMDLLMPPKISDSHARLKLQSEPRDTENRSMIMESQFDVQSQTVSHSSSGQSMDSHFRFHAGLLRQDSLNIKYVRPETSEASPQVPYCSPPSADAIGLPQSQSWSELRLASPVAQQQQPLNDEQSAQPALIKLIQEQSQQIMQLKDQMSRIDRKYASAHNQALRVIQSHEDNLMEMTQRNQTNLHELHLAFLFASPLHIPVQQRQYQQQNDGKEFVLMKPLNFQKEFMKIHDAIAQSQFNLRLTKRQCTLSSLNEILAKNPMAIHFSGHGFRNSKEDLGTALYNQHQNEGNLLLLETEFGEGVLVSTQTLKDMVYRNYQEKSKVLQLVVVASCHSEFVGKIFIEAGAQHVVCIEQQEEVDDDAVITFTESFYMLLFNTNMICDAFEQAQKQVSLAHSDQQASIFKMLRQENVKCDKVRKNSKTGSRKRRCTQFGPFERGMISLIDQANVTFTNRAPPSANLIGRQADQFKLINVLLKEARLVTLMGHEGIGKSSLVMNALDWMHERCLLHGGSIYFNARDIRCCTVLNRKLCRQIMSNAEILFHSIAKLVNCDKYPQKALKIVLTKLAMIQGKLLLVIDNADELIHNDNSNFQKLLLHMMSRAPSLKVLITSCTLLHAKSLNQQIIRLEGLTVAKSYELFREVSGPIEQAEQNMLLKRQPDYEQFQEERQYLQPQRLADHHFFRLLNGNPQSIILMASVRADPQRDIDLPKLYEIMTSGQTKQLLQKARINDKNMRESLIRAAQVATQHMIDHDSESSSIFFLFSMLPGGVTDRELEEIWNIQNNRSPQMQSTTAALTVSLQRVKNKLLRANLIKRESKDILRMPEYVRKFSEGRIDEEDDVKLHSILANWLEKKAFAIYISTSTGSAAKLSSEKKSAHLQHERFERNMDAFVERQIFYEIHSDTAVEEAVDAVSKNQTVLSCSVISRARAFDLYSDEVTSYHRFDQDQDQDEPGSVDWGDDLSINDDASFTLGFKNRLIDTGSLRTNSMSEKDFKNSEGENKNETDLDGSQPQDRSSFLLAKLKDAMKSKFPDIIEQIQRDETRAMNMPRGSISKKACKVNEVSGQGIQRRYTLLSQKSQQREVAVEKDESDLSVAERAILFYLVGKLLNENYSSAKKMIVQSSGGSSLNNDRPQLTLEQMYISSFFFRGNVRRLQAHCLMVELEKDFRYSKINRAANALNRAQISFKKAKSAWGLGLTYLQEALLVSLQLKNMRERERSNFRNALDDQLESKQELLARFKDCIAFAMTELQKANHRKGLDFTRRLKVKVLSEQRKQEHYRNMSRDSDNERQEFINESIQEEEDETQIYFIEREQGEEFSLMTEIVLGSTAQSIFKRSLEVIEEEEEKHQLQEQNEAQSQRQVINQGRNQQLLLKQRTSQISISVTNLPDADSSDIKDEVTGNIQNYD